MFWVFLGAIIINILSAVFLYFSISSNCLSTFATLEKSTIAKNIKHYRKKLELSQDKLSKLAGVAYNTIVKIESGENPNPTIETLTKIARALNVDIADLIK